MCHLRRSYALSADRGIGPITVEGIVQKLRRARTGCISVDYSFLCRCSSIWLRRKYHMDGTKLKINSPQRHAKRIENNKVSKIRSSRVSGCVMSQEAQYMNWTSNSRPIYTFIDAQYARFCGKSVFRRLYRGLKPVWKVPVTHDMCFDFKIIEIKVKA